MHPPTLLAVLSCSPAEGRAPGLGVAGPGWRGPKPGPGKARGGAERPSTPTAHPWVASSPPRPEELREGVGRAGVAAARLASAGGKGADARSSREARARTLSGRRCGAARVGVLRRRAAACALMRTPRDRPLAALARRAPRSPGGRSGGMAAGAPHLLAAESVRAGRRGGEWRARSARDLGRKEAADLVPKPRRRKRLRV